MHVPDPAERSEGQPSLEDQGYSPSPVDKVIADGELLDHVVIADVIDDEWEGMHEGHDEERI
jgi:hypothetical protein